MQDSKIRLSPAELALFCDAQMILTKNSILQKTSMLLGEVQEEILACSPPLIRDHSPSPKISRGENYLGLPWLILDYPRIARAENLFFIRSMFWWGHFFSSTLQLAGSFREQFIPRLTNGYEQLKAENYSVGINDDPWVHHFHPDNYRPIAQLSRPEFAAILTRQAHIKIAACWPLSEWDKAAKNLSGSWTFLTGLIA